jgi:Spy/CpxP family protein refolding chaperone
MNPSRLLQKIHAMVTLMTTSSAPISMAALFVTTTIWRRMLKEFWRMKKLFVCALLVLAVACGGTALYAQDTMSQSGGQGGGGGRHMMSPDQRLQHMTQQLNLTADQQQKIKPILEEESQQMQTLRQDSSVSGADRMSKMQQIRQGTNDQIKAVLNPDQQQKFEEMQTHRMAPQGMQGQPPQH